VTTVLVTGAAGFIGQAVCRNLRLCGHTIRGTTRKFSADFGFPVFPVGDIGPDTDWRAALAGCSAVIHLAAHVHVASVRDNATDFNYVNVKGTENLLRQAARAGVRRFLFVSSVKVYGDSSEGRSLVENAPAVPVDAYGESKRQAEFSVKAIGEETGMEVVIVRPPLVYGARVKANFLKLVRAIDAGVPLPLASIDNRRSLIYLGNLADALIACMTHPAAANRTFLVSDDHDVSSPQLIREIAKALGRKPRLFQMPSSWLKAISSLTGHSQEMKSLIGSLCVDISSIKSSLGWAPPFTMQEGLKETMSWYRSASPLMDSYP
jgi:nucleoside-diphosphate-sugar epimerase